MSDIVSTETPVSTPTVAEQPQAPPDSTSVADHAATFSPQARDAAAEAAVDDNPPVTPPVAGETPQQAEQRARDEQGRFARERHRARSQQAGPADVPRIRELTRKLRDTERIVAELQAKVTPPVKPMPLVPPEARIPPVDTSGFAKPKPRLEEFGDQDDALEAWNLALGRWDRERERFEERQAETRQRAEREVSQASAGSQEWLKSAGDGYISRQQAFIARTPDYAAKMESVKHIKTTPLLSMALLTSDKSAEIEYYLATHPSIYDEALLNTHGKEITEETVATTQRWLTSRSQAASTGSAAAAPIRLPPKPPNPVRTGPMPPSDEPPGEASSISDHRRHYGPSR